MGATTPTTTVWYGIDDYSSTVLLRYYYDYYDYHDCYVLLLLLTFTDDACGTKIRMLEGGRGAYKYIWLADTGVVSWVADTGGVSCLFDAVVNSLVCLCCCKYQKHR